MRPIIENWAQNKTAQEASKVMIDHGVPACPVQNELDVIDCPHIKARNMLVDIDDPDFGKVKQPGNAVKFSAVPKEAFLPPPRLGEHNQEIFGGLLGLSQAKIEELRQAGII